MKLARVLPVLLALLLPAQSNALSILAHQEHFDSGTQTFQFSITLSAAPDFYTVDQFGREKDMFQYWITWQPNPLATWPYGNPDVLVRGPEIYVNGTLPVRDAKGPQDPTSGGWGPIRGSVPYALNGTVLTFTIPQSVIGDADGVFQYYLIVDGNFGATEEIRAGISDGPVPAAAASWGRVKAFYR
jgi:hypothetical protein